MVVQHLLRMGEPVLSPSLSSVELLCTERACLQRLGRAYSAHRLLGGEIFPNDRSFLVRLWLYDLDNEQPLLVEERCTECTEELLLESVSRAAGRLVDAVAASAPLSAPASTPTVAPGPVATTGPAKATAPPPPAAPATSLGLVGLASAIALSAKDGEVYLPADGDAYPTDLLNDFGRTARSLYGVSALGILGGAAAFAPWERWTQRGLPACPDRPQGRWTFRRGLAVGAFGSMTVAGLIVSSTMAGLDGKTWGFNQIGTPVPYQLQTATQAGFGATVGMGVGLALSLLIP